MTFDIFNARDYVRKVNQSLRLSKASNSRLLRQSSSLKVELTFEDLTCAICLESFEEKEDGPLQKETACQVVSLTCNECHTFHPPCLEEWLTRSPECPLCKTNVFT